MGKSGHKPVSTMMKKIGHEQDAEAEAESGGKPRAGQIADMHGQEQARSEIRIRGQTQAAGTNHTKAVVPNSDEPILQPCLYSDRYTPV